MPSWRDSETLLLFFADERDAVLLVRLQPKACGGGNDTFDRRELFGNERRDFLQGPAFDDDQQIRAARHEVTALHFRKARDAIREPVETAAAFRRDFHLDDRRDDLDAAFLRVATLGPEAAARRSPDDGKRSPVEIY